jgi:hypothetical protein
VAIDRQAWNAKCVAEDNVRGLPAYAREADEIGHGLRDFATVSLDNRGRHPEERSGLGTKEPGGLNLRLEFRRRRLRERGGVRVTREESRRDPVDALVGALR